MGGEEKKDVDWLRQLCGDDTKLYDVLASSLYLDPMAAISKEDLGVLIEEAEKSVKDENYEEAIRKYRPVVDKAIFEATQHQEEKDRYIKIIQDLVSKSAQATEKVKEKSEKEGPADYVARLERRIDYYKFVSERIEDVMKVASLYYNERLAVLGEKGRREERLDERRERKSTEDRGEKRGKISFLARVRSLASREDSEEKRDKKREKERREERVEEEREEKQEEKEEKEKGEARREKILEERR